MSADHFDAVIVGTGPAGLLAGRILESHGLSVQCIDANYGAVSAQSDHVHFFAQPALEVIARWCPDFRQRLIEQGVRPADCDGRSTAIDTGSLWPSRRAFDGALHAACQPRNRVLLDRVRRIGYRQGSWVLSGRFGSVRSRILVDASGRSRCTLNHVGRLAAKPVVINEGPSTASYLSCVTSGVNAAGSQLVVKLRGVEDEVSLLALRLEKEKWQLTLALPPDSAIRNWKTAVNALPAQARTFLDGHQHPAKTHRYGGQRSSFLMADNSTTPAGWLPLGDSLFTSPPYQGNGVHNLVAQLRLLDDGLHHKRSLPDIRDSIFDLANSAWLRATLLDTLSNPTCLSEQALTAFA